MIVAAGLTPAWQQIMRFESFRPGEVNRALEVHWCASGKVLNVAIALTHLGADCEAVSLVGGASGEAIEREFDALGIRRRWIEAEGSTRVCTTILDTQSGFTTELVENAGPALPAELARFEFVYAESAAKADVVVLTGSLPAGAPPTFFRSLLDRTPGRVVLDCRGKELIEALDSQPFLVKPNREELARTLERSLSCDKELHTAMRDLNDRGAQWVVVSDGSKPLWVSTSSKLYRIIPPRARSVNPIGSGDCLAAGIACELFNEKPPLEAIRWGIAAAVDNLGQLLPSRLDPVRVRHLVESVVVDEV